MTKQQHALVEQARQSLDAAKLLTEAGHCGFASAQSREFLELAERQLGELRGPEQ
jgi:hypothetical protein